MTTSPSEDRTDVERVFDIYVRSITAADVGLASQAWLQSPDVLIVTPFGRFRGWDSVKNDIYPSTRTAFPERLLQASDVSLVVSGDVAWLVYDFVFSGKRANGEPFRFTGWESHGYQRTPTGWRIAHLHYSLPAPNPDGDVA
jgi:ketosteroid isomerase-like protein